ncbi:MAG: hypothetical protein AAGD25_03505 [Cyanobacteria bacterium P01_F01_bin.150]
MTEEVKNILSAADTYHNMLACYEYIKKFYTTLDKHLEYGEIGKKFLPISKNRIFVDSNDYALYSKHPYSDWLSPWYGRFYVDNHHLSTNFSIDDHSVSQVTHLIFAWLWIGCKDPLVPNAEHPECWIGVVETQSSNPDARIYDVADMIYKFLRIESSISETPEGWVRGRLFPNDVGSQASGFWELKRFPLKNISTPYDIHHCIVDPLTKKYDEISNR